MTYVDGFVAAVPTAGRETYRAYAEKMAAIFREYGALQVVECWGDDVPEGKLTSFPMAVKAGADETVVFSWVLWADKPTRDAAWPRLTSDPRMGSGADPMPFDGQRMIYGGFQMIVDA
jgi:uncharacterized protein YbaA (DUF1428 family)